MADGGVWVRVYGGDSGGGIPEGAPPAPVLTNPEGGSVIKFTSGGDGDAGPTLAYGATITPDATLTVDQDNLEVQVSGTESFTDYVVSVYAVNVAGRGEVAKTDAFQLNYNAATGGDEVKDITRIGDGSRWRYHKFTTVGTSTFTITENPKPDDYEVLVVAGGGGGGGWAFGGGGGGAGGLIHETQYTITDTTTTVTVGGAGTASNVSNPSYGSKGGNSKFGTVEATGGGGGAGASDAGGPLNGGSGGGTYLNNGGSNTPGSGVPGQGHNGGNGQGSTGGGGGAGGAGSINAAPGVGKTIAITGTDVQYARGGQGAAGGNPAQPYNSPGSGGGGAGHWGAGKTQVGTNGKGGVVIVAYQIAATSTTRQIEQAQAEAAAREAGYATGYGVGVTDGREQAVEEVKAMAASTVEVEE